MTQNNLGTVLAMLGERERNTMHLKEAIRAYCDVIEVAESGGHKPLLATAHLNLAQAKELLEQWNI